MAQLPENGWPVSGILILLAAWCGTAGCVTGASTPKPPQDPAEARAQLVKKLSPAEITAAADQAARRGEYERAVTMYNQAIEAEPSADLWFRVGWIYAHLAKNQLAAQAFAHTLEFDANHAGAHEELGFLYLESKQRGNAAIHLRRAVEIDPSRWRSHNALGVLADASHDYAAAMGHYLAALAVRPGSAMLLNNLGYSHYLAGSLDEAELLYQQAQAAQPGYRPVLANIGLLHARRGHYDQALEVMTGVMGAAQAHNDVGYVAYQNGDLGDAERLLTEAIRLSPSYYETAHKNLARVQGAQAGAASTPTPVAAR